LIDLAIWRSVERAIDLDGAAAEDRQIDHQIDRSPAHQVDQPITRSHDQPIPPLSDPSIFP
jgi:hypothetical protein